MALNLTKWHKKYRWAIRNGDKGALWLILLFRNDKYENNRPAIVVECKAEHISIREEDYFQGFNYASWAGADFLFDNLF